MMRCSEKKEFGISNDGVARHTSKVRGAEALGARGALKLGPIKIHGALLAHGFPKGYFQPVISPVQLESVPPGTSGEIAKLTKTIGTDDADYDRIDRDLRHAEENAIVMTSLIARVKVR